MSSTEDENPWSSPRIYTIYCLFHLGDHIYNMNLFRQIEPILRAKNRVIHYYCPKQYHEQVAEFAPPADVLEIRAMCDLDGDAIFDKGLSPGWFSPLHELHIENKKLPKNIFNRTHTNFDKFYEEFYTQFLETWFGAADIASTFAPKFIAQKDPDLLRRYENLHEKYKDLDILVINSPPTSRRCSRPGHTWDKYILSAASSGLKIATTAPLSTSAARSRAPPCIMDDNLTIKTISAISTRAKSIIAVNTGPLAGCFNEITMEFVDKVYVFDKENTFAHEKVVSCEKIEDIPMQFVHTPKPVRKIPISF